MTFNHQPVLLEKAIECLAIQPNGIYIDATFGRGGHSQAILNVLNEQGRLIAIDKDLDAIEHAQSKFGNDKRFEIENASFADIKVIAKRHQIEEKVDGILLDLGVSSPQIDDASRGFSFSHDGPLDMRMNTNQPFSAYDFIHDSDVSTLSQIFKQYGEERYAKRIANAIISAREVEDIRTTKALAEIVKAANPNWEKHKHPATRVFQAIRIYVNNELGDLQKGLNDGFDVLKKGGRMAVISFHSLEDRLVKTFMRDKEKGPQLPLNIPIKHKDIQTSFKRIGKAIKPSLDAIENNARARSAVLRIGEKLS